ncbi:MAG: peroxisomal assembly protein [Piccolia ochrophora]|nr:MAG: peroxisomal assembly protein [Piccolia ochrophora]
MMEHDRLPLHHTKRRRRRGDKPPLSAHLIIDERNEGEVGVLSDDLAADLFPARSHGSGAGTSLVEDVRYIAICPWAPLSPNFEHETPWTIVPINASSRNTSGAQGLSNSTVQLSRHSFAFQHFFQDLRSLNPTSGAFRARPPIEIRVLDVVPLRLETIFASVHHDILGNPGLQPDGRPPSTNTRSSNGVNIKGRDGLMDKKPRRGPSYSKNPQRNNAPTPGFQESLLCEAIRRALKAPNVVHTGDLLGLPLPSNPITHLPPPPARISFCEPVSQGILAAETRIIVSVDHHRDQTRHNIAAFSASHEASGVVAGDGDDTSDERFYSAAEDGMLTSNSSATEAEVISSTSPSGSGSSEKDDLSDDSLDGMISLQGPSLAPHTSSVHSAFQPGTPGSITVGHQTNGIGTPGSRYSSFTASTARPSNIKGRLFKTQGLLMPISDELLYPRPKSDEDDEARVFVETASLAKLGCFSGDWVRLEMTDDDSMPRSGDWGFGNFEGPEDQHKEWRAVKIYGLPEAYVARARHSVLGSAKTDRQEGLDSARKAPAPHVYMSPVILYNMSETTYLHILPLMDVSSSLRNGLPASKANRGRISASSTPSIAKEVTLLKVATPLTTDRALQESLLISLKQYFEGRSRIVKNGDLLAVRLDLDLARITFHDSPQGNAESDMLELMSLPALKSRDSQALFPSSNAGVAWFRIGHITPAARTLGDSANQDWGEIVTVDPMSTRMVQAGSTQSKIPSTINNSWETYFGLKPAPKQTLGPAIRAQLSRSLFGAKVIPLRRRLRELITAATSPWATSLDLQPLAILLSSTQRNTGKATVTTQACADLGIHIFELDAYEILSEGGSGGDVKTEAYIKARADRAIACGPQSCALLIRHVEALTAARMISALKEVIAESRVVIATTTEVDKVPDGVRGLFTHELEMSAPGEVEREILLRGIVEEKGILPGTDVDLSSVALKTAALVAGDLVDVANRAVVARQERLEGIATACNASASHVPVTLRDVELAGGPSAQYVAKVDFEVAVEAARKNFADSIGAPKIPNVTWDDVGGLTNVKDAVMETIQLPLERPELFAKGMKKRSGILFYGPPGTGKTLLAKAIATEFSLNFFSVKGPELLNMYIGESEANVRRVFQRARDARPCVVFFDELDSVAPKRGNQGDSGGVMDRIVSQLLAELDGMSDGKESGGGVFVIGATNRPDLLDAALLRPGRFDKMLYLGVADTHAKQLTILEALTRKFLMHPDLSLRRVADALPFTYTGADLYALGSDAMLKAITRQALAVDEKIKRLPHGPVTTAYYFDHFATKEDLTVMVTEDDFSAAQRELVGSVSAKELEHYDRVRKSFESNDEASTSQISGGPTALLQDVPGNDHPKVTRLKGKHGAKSTVPTDKGKGKAASTSWDAEENAADGYYYDHRSDDDNDNIIHTGDAATNGHQPTNGNWHSKQKRSNKFEDPSLNDEEELYG